MILVIDIGNTKIKLGFFKNKKLTKEESFITFDDFKKKIHLLNHYSIILASLSAAPALDFSSLNINWRLCPPANIGPSKTFLNS